MAEGVSNGGDKVLMFNSRELAKEILEENTNLVEFCSLSCSSVFAVYFKRYMKMFVESCIREYKIAQVLMW